MPKAKGKRAKKDSGPKHKKTAEDGFNLNPIIEEKIKEALQKGLTRNQACDYANISRSVFYEILAKNKEYYPEGERLADRIEQWESALNIQAKFNIAGKIGSGDVETSKWLLERKEKETYSTRTEQTGKDGEPLGVILYPQKDEGILEAPAETG
jgi:hypothetical protein